MAHVSIRDWCRSQGTPVANKDDTPLPLQGRAVSMATGLRLGLPVPCSKRRRFGKKRLATESNASHLPRVRCGAVRD